jgi:hypothetical protein
MQWKKTGTSGVPEPSYAMTMQTPVWANQLVDAHDIELWSGERFVTRINTQAGVRP